MRMRPAGCTGRSPCQACCRMTTHRLFPSAKWLSGWRRASPLRRVHYPVMVDCPIVLQGECGKFLIRVTNPSVKYETLLSPVALVLLGCAKLPCYLFAARVGKRKPYWQGRHARRGHREVPDLA